MCFCERHCPSRALSFHPPRHFASEKRAAAAEEEEESILMVSGSLATANSIGGEFDLGAGDPSDIAKTTFPPFLLQSPQFVEQTDHIHSWQRK